MIHIRHAGVIDTHGMAGLLNDIIRKGGNTAITQEITRDTLVGWFEQGQPNSAWHVAEDDTGTILGFQYIKPEANLPPEACDIATFVDLGTSGLGIGSKLFETTKKAARDMGYKWINATIRADNTGGLAYYQSRGFEDYAHLPNQELCNDQIVDKISKRYDL